MGTRDESSLSAYWVKFFKNAGFPSDVATRHALVFSNNRIKPDMLPDLDKPSLKEMGITLMGDMIAIIRYAKKVVEETTCKKFLVSSEDSPVPVKSVSIRPVVKKIVAKPLTKTSATPKIKSEASVKMVKTVSNVAVKPSLTIKKKSAPVIPTSRMYSDYIDNTQRPKTTPMKRKYNSDEEEIDGKWVHNDTAKRLKPSESNVKYTVIMPKETTVTSQKLLKKAVETKRTVFHRLGDSKVTSTTNITESSNANFNPTFSITGLGSDYGKRNSSVFRRLGNKDNEVNEYNKHLRNGITTTGTQSILKTRTPFNRTTIIATKPPLNKSVGTMRADEEATRKSMFQGVRQLVKTTKPYGSNLRSTNPSRNIQVTGKLASERMEIPAKSRLGASKQVTFNKMTTVNNIRKQGVFSRLGV